MSLEERERVFALVKRRRVLAHTEENGPPQIAAQSEKIRARMQLDAREGLRTSCIMPPGTLSPDTHQKLFDELRTRLRRELDAVGIAKKKLLTEDAIKLTTVEENLASVKGKLVQQVLQVKIERYKRLKLEETLHALESQTRRQMRKWESDLFFMKEEVDNWRDVAVAHIEECEEYMTENEELTYCLDMIRDDLEEQQEKSLCRICLDSPKDAICFPCRHLHYCSPCLEKHQKQTNSCPTCRQAILAVFKCIM